MRALLLSIIMLYSFSANAGCTSIAELRTSTLFIDISDGGCGPLNISFTNKIGKDGRPDYESMKVYRFDDECALKFDKIGRTTGFSCRANGHTPLAGATYKLKQFGFFMLNCGDGEGGKGEGQKWPRNRYVCVAGCNKTSAPKSLDEIVTCD